MTEGLEDRREEIFEGLKMKLDIVSDMNEIFKDDIDPNVEYQLEMAKQDIRNDLKTLSESGDSIMDLYKRFGALLFKAKVVQA